MIVALAAVNIPRLTIDPTEPAQTITAYIVAISQGETPRGTVGYQSIFAAGLVLFAMTLAFNLLGYWLRRRYHRAYGIGLVAKLVSPRKWQDPSLQVGGLPFSLCRLRRPG